MAIIKPIHLLRCPPQRGEGSPTFGIVSLAGGLGLVDFNTSCHQTNLPAAQRVLKPSFTDSNLPRGAIRETRTRTGGSVLFFPPSCETLRTKEPHLVPKPHPGMSGLCQSERLDAAATSPAKNSIKINRCPLHLPGFNDFPFVSGAESAVMGWASGIRGTGPQWRRAPRAVPIGCAAPPPRPQHVVRRGGGP